MKNQKQQKTMKEEYVCRTEQTKIKEEKKFKEQTN